MEMWSLLPLVVLVCSVQGISLALSKDNWISTNWQVWYGGAPQSMFKKKKKNKPQDLHGFVFTFVFNGGIVIHTCHVWICGSVVWLFFVLFCFCSLFSGFCLFIVLTKYSFCKCLSIIQCIA